MRWKNAFQQQDGDSSKRERTLLDVTLIAAMLGCLILLLTSCDPAPRTEVIRIEPEPRYTRPCPVPEPEGVTVEHIVETYVSVLQQQIHSCDERFSRIREWAEGEDAGRND